MRKKKLKRNYFAPSCMMVQVNETTNLMATSFPSQHNPATPGGTISNAKSAQDWMLEDNEENGSPSWED